MNTMTPALRPVLLICIITALCHIRCYAQNNDQGADIKGIFLRSGVFSGNTNTSNPASLYIEAGYKNSYNSRKGWFGIINTRYRYGIDYGETGGQFYLKEAYAGWRTTSFSVIAGQQVVKWSNSDFYMSADKLNSRDDLIRTIEQSDRDRGNIMINFGLFPGERMALYLYFIPFFRASELSAGSIDMPGYVDIRQLPDIVSGSEAAGIRLTYNFRGADMSFSAYRGPDPLPLTKPGEINFANGGVNGMPGIILDSDLFVTNMLSAGFETVAASTVLRSELSYTQPDNHPAAFIPKPELTFTAGVEPYAGYLNIVFEYCFKYILNHKEHDVDPVFPDENNIPANLQPAELEAYLEEIIKSFNSLYRFQQFRFFHSLGININYTRDLALIRPGLSLMYNVSGRELYTRTYVKIKPADNIIFTVGADFYSGNDNSLFKLLSDRFNSFYAGFKIDF